MADRGMIFTGPSIQAILAGRKTQTRRLVRFPVWAAGCFDNPLKLEVETDKAGHGPEVICNDTGCLAALPLPFAVGDRLWVRETHRFRGATYLSDSDPEPEWFRVRSKDGDSWDPEFPSGWSPKRYHDATEPEEQSDGEITHLTPWISPIHMPRWASRLTLIVTDIRVERLRDISEADALAEGVGPTCQPDPARPGLVWVGSPLVCKAPTLAYRDLWTEIHGRDAWDANPWVAAITFKVEERNIAGVAVNMEAAA